MQETVQFSHFKRYLQNGLEYPRMIHFLQERTVVLNSSLILLKLRIKCIQFRFHELLAKICLKHTNSALYNICFFSKKLHVMPRCVKTENISSTLLIPFELRFNNLIANRKTWVIFANLSVIM